MNRGRGFSLLEVVIAIGIFAGSVVVVLSSLPALVRQSADSADLLVAQRFTDGVHLELERQAKRSGFDRLAGAIPIMNAPLRNGWPLVATADGQFLQPVADGAGPPIATNDQYFSLELWRFSQPPLSFDPSHAALAMYVRVSWPYHVPGSADVTPIEARDEFTFTVAINR